MKSVLRVCLSLALVFSSLPAQAGTCGVFSRSRCVNKVAFVPQSQTIISVQSVPVQVTFVPSQVLLNGQVTQYTQTPFSYSYQGSAIDPNAYAAQQQQQRAQVANSLESRMTRLENLVLEIAKRQGIDVQGTNQPTVQSKDSFDVWTTRDTQHVTSAWASCKKCHSPGGKGSEELVMFDVEGTVLPALPRFAIYKAIHDGHMPPDPAQRIKGEQLESLRKWVHKDLKNLNY